jgi:hypothetical protein
MDDHRETVMGKAFEPNPWLELPPASPPGTCITQDRHGGGFSVWTLWQSGLLRLGCGVRRMGGFGCI